MNGARLVGSGTWGDGGFRHGKLRATLVIGQVALSIVLLTGAALMIRSLYRLTHVELGFNAKTFWWPDLRRVEAGFSKWIER